MTIGESSADDPTLGVSYHDIPQMFSKDLENTLRSERRTMQKVAGSVLSAVTLSNECKKKMKAGLCSESLRYTCLYAQQNADRATEKQLERLVNISDNEGSEDQKMRGVRAVGDTQVLPMTYSCGNLLSPTGKELSTNNCDQITKQDDQQRSSPKDASVVLQRLTTYGEFSTFLCMNKSLIRKLLDQKAEAPKYTPSNFLRGAAKRVSSLEGGLAGFVRGVTTSPRHKGLFSAPLDRLSRGVAEAGRPAPVMDAEDTSIFQYLVSSGGRRTSDIMRRDGMGGDDVCSSKVTPTTGSCTNTDNGWRLSHTLVPNRNAMYNAAFPEGSDAHRWRDKTMWNGGGSILRSRFMDYSDADNFDPSTQGYANTMHLFPIVDVEESPAPVSLDAVVQRLQEKHGADAVAGALLNVLIEPAKLRKYVVNNMYKYIEEQFRKIFISRTSDLSAVRTWWKYEFLTCRLSMQGIFVKNDHKAVACANYLYLAAFVKIMGGSMVNVFIVDDSSGTFPALEQECKDHVGARESALNERYDTWFGFHPVIQSDVKIRPINCALDRVVA